MPKILVADDEFHILKIVAYKLRLQEYTVISAEDGLEALEKTKAEKPDLIILDIKMPKLNGFQVLEALRKDPEISGTPVFMLTVWGGAMDRQKGQELGVIEYIVKPFSPTELLAKVDAFFGRKES